MNRTLIKYQESTYSQKFWPPGLDSRLDLTRLFFSFVLFCFCFLFIGVEGLKRIGQKTNKKNPDEPSPESSPDFPTGQKLCALDCQLMAQITLMVIVEMFIYFFLQDHLIKFLQTFAQQQCYPTYFQALNAQERHTLSKIGIPS